MTILIETGDCFGAAMLKGPSLFFDVVLSKRLIFSVLVPKKDYSYLDAL